MSSAGEKASLPARVAFSLNLDTLCNINAVLNFEFDVD